MAWLSDPAIWTALLTLTALEIVLGIDNIIFISILADRLPASQRQRARTTGLLLAMLMRIAMLFSLGWMLGLTQTLFTLAAHPFNGRDLILLLGGSSFSTSRRLRFTPSWRGKSTSVKPASAPSRSRA